MAKTCRTCRRIYPVWRCTRPDVFDADPNEIMDCHEPRETPLLVDVLAETLHAVLRQRNLVGRIELSLAGEAQIIDVLARYQEEVGNDKL